MIFTGLSQLLLGLEIALFQIVGFTLVCYLFYVSIRGYFLLPFNHIETKDYVTNFNQPEQNYKSEVRDSLEL